MKGFAGKDNRIREGQATLVLVVAVMVVSLAVGASSARRAITGIKRSAYTQQADQAYSCAESGAEQGVSKATNDWQGSIGSYPSQELTSKDGVLVCNYSYSISNVAEAENSGCAYSLDAPVSKDDVFEVNLRDYSGQFSLHWGNSNNASLEITLIKGLSAPYEVEKSAFYCENTPSPDNGFSAGNKSSPLVGYYCSTSAFSVSSDYQIARVRPLFESTNIKAFFNSACGSVPAQGYKILSVGMAGEVKKSLQVKVTNPQLSSLFDFVLFSGGDISK